MSAGGADQVDRDVVADFLGLLAGIEIAAFPGHGRVVGLAATAADQAAAGALAVAGFRHFQGLCGRLAELDADPDERMRPFHSAVTGFERRTEPADAYEALVKIYIAEGLAADLHRRAAAHLDATSRALVEDMLAGDARAELAVSRVRAATEGDTALAGRLSLWARRLVGEVIGRAQAAVASRPGLAEAIVGTAPERPAGTDRLPEGAARTGSLGVKRAVNRCAGEHGERMREIGLTP